MSEKGFEEKNKKDRNLIIQDKAKLRAVKIKIPENKVYKKNFDYTDKVLEKDEK